MQKLERIRENCREQVLMLHGKKITLCDCNFSQKTKATLTLHPNFTGSYAKSVEVLMKFNIHRISKGRIVNKL